MFQNWGFLITEIVGLLLLAALLGLFVGWLVWGRRGTAGDSSERARLRTELETCRAEAGKAAARVAALEAALVEARTEAARAAVPAAMAAVSAELEVPMAEAEADAPGDGGAADYDRDGVLEDKAEGQRPAALAAPRGGKADDLKLIWGVGPKLEALCHRLGFYHFEQIAGWSEAEIAWVDANLEGFRGRVSRDKWVLQAKVLAAGGSALEAERAAGVGDGK